MLDNGVLSDAINAAERGLLYGDGVFPTLRIVAGRSRHRPRHCHKLRQDCAVLNLPRPDAAVLSEELQRLIGQQSEGVAKIIITRAQGSAGYAPPASAVPTRILNLAPAPEYPAFPHAGHSAAPLLAASGAPAATGRHQASEPTGIRAGCGIERCA
ncbi:MAG: aminotransferase class IV [Gallionellaceae bacterium]